MLLSEPIGYRLVRSGLYIAAITSRLEVCAFAFYFPTYPLAKQEPSEWRNNTWKTTRMLSHHLMSKTSMQMGPRIVEAMHRRRMLRRRHDLFLRPRTLTSRNKYSRLLKVIVLNSPRVVAGQGDLPRMGSCPRENVRNLPESRSWPQNAKPTAESLHLLRTNQRLARPLPVLEIPSVRPVAKVLRLRVFLLFLLLVPL